MKHNKLRFDKNNLSLHNYKFECYLNLSIFNILCKTIKTVKYLSVLCEYIVTVYGDLIFAMLMQKPTVYWNMKNIQ